MSQEIIAVLDKIASYLGTTSDKVIVIITKMAFADAFVASITLVLTILLLVIIVVASYKFAMYFIFKSELEQDSKVLIGIIPAVITTMGIIVLLINIYTQLLRLSGFFSPELWAYYEILPKIMK